MAMDQGFKQLMKIYIDCGAFTGDTVDCEFLFNFKADKKIAFEANPDLLPYVTNKAFDEVHNKAVWTKNGEVVFYQDQSKRPLGSTIKGSKTTGILKPISVEAIDFSEYIKSYKKDNVLVKMDCEGAEFDILEKMIIDGTITIPSALYVEFHPNKVPEYTTTYKNDLVKRIRQLGVKIEEWH